VRSISRKTAAWASGAVIAVGGATAGIIAATSGGGETAAQSAAATAKANMAAHAAKIAAEPLRLVSITPGADARAANGAAGVTVTYNKPLPDSAAMPTLKPAIAGSWKRQGDAVVFTPTAGYPAGTKVTVTAVAVQDKTTDSTTSSSFTTGKYSTLRLQEILAQLGYLPLNWTAATGASAPGDNAQAQLAAAYDPPAGSFSWQSGYPSSLHSLWAKGSANTVDTGALYGFEAAHQLTVSATINKTVWASLLKAAAANDKNISGYSYAIANQHLPETLTIWHDGQKRLTTPANTGISVSQTEVGTFPVYEKLPFQIMSGTNPDGSHYADPVQWVSYFNGGDAVHYFPRGSYGWNQSLGCVELPWSNSETAYHLLPYGTLVTVTEE
jgi:lipoprotein-anchoring transpeptidase ErfK/SrfK